MTTVTDPGRVAADVGGTAGARCASPPPCVRHTAPGSPDTGGVTTSPGYIRALEPSRSFTVPGKTHTTDFFVLKAYLRFHN